MDRERTLLRGFANASRQLLVLELIARLIIPLPPYNLRDSLGQGLPLCYASGAGMSVPGNGRFYIRVVTPRHIFRIEL